jgi:hypothetical protein
MPLKDKDAEKWARVKKWEVGLDPTTATKEDIKDYVESKIWEYTQNEVADHILWELFRYDFRFFNSTSAFDKLQILDRSKLRAYLRCGGIYIPPSDRHLSAS